MGIRPSYVPGLVQTSKAFRYRVYPTPTQVARLGEWQGALRWLWNLGNEQRRLGYGRQVCRSLENEDGSTHIIEDRRIFPTAFDQINELTELRAGVPWLAEVPRNVCAQLLVELDLAWQRCFRKLARTPRWKRKDRDTLSFSEPHPKTWGLVDGHIRFPKLGLLRTVMHRPFEGTPKRCTLRNEAGQWFVSILCEVEIPDPIPRKAPVVAIDRGVVNVFADSNGWREPSPRYHRKALRRLAHAQRVVSRREKGSKNQKKAKARVAVLHRTVRRQREQFLHTHSARYAKSHGVIGIEKLNVAGMMRGHCSQGIADAGWSSFAAMLRYKLAWSGGFLVEVPAQYSSQTCSKCKAVDGASRRSQSEFCCTSCGFCDHADLNAAKVLLDRVNRSVLLSEGLVLEATRRPKKQLRVARRSPESSSL